MTEKDIDINVAEQIIARKRKAEMDRYGEELRLWLEERDLQLEATIILKKGQVLPIINLVRIPRENKNGAGG